MSALVVPGVRVEARFDVPPPPPSPTGILGLVGLIDRPAAGLVGLTSTTEIEELLGPATPWAMPELATALRNGAAEVVVSAVNPASAGTARRTFADRDGEDVLRLVARAPGPWGNGVEVAIDEVMGADGRSVRYVNVRVFVDGDLVEHHRSLTVDARDPGRDLYAVINARSRVLVAVDPTFESDGPRALTPTAFDDAAATAARRTLTAAGADVLRVEAKEAGDRGNQISVEVAEGRPARVLLDGADAPSLRVTAREAGGDPVRVGVTAGGTPGTVTLSVLRALGTPTTYADLGAVADIVAALRGDPDVSVVSVAGASLPAPLPSPQALQATRTVVVRPQGEAEARAEDRLTLAEVVTAFAGNLFVSVAAVAGASSLPDAAAGFLGGGRAAGPALRLRGQANSSQDVVELVPLDGQDPTGWTVRVARTADRFTLELADPGSGRTLESHAGLTMDPDDARFLPAVLLSESTRLQAFDLLVRSRTTALPRATPGAVALQGGSAPATADFLAAISALEADERIDLVAASVQSHSDPNLDVRQVHQALLAFAISASDRGAPALALGSVSPAAQGNVADILDHANDVRHQRFILCSPSGTHAAVAGMIGRMNVHFSPTFKSPGFLPVPAATYSDSELKRLVDPTAGNVLVVQKHRHRGIIVVKGIATNGWQINVTRTADLAVREVKKISEGYIGELNDEAARNALQQQLVAFFLRLERDGAIVPSTDGKDPAFQVRVYATQQDFAQGIVRIDLAMRPVRAIDYVYATLRVRN